MSTTVHVGAVPEPVKVSVVLRDNVSSIVFVYTGPSNQSITAIFDAQPNGRATMVGFGYPSNGFSPYAAAGTWTLTLVRVYARTGVMDYTGAALASLFPSLTFNVVNPNADTTAPVINSAVIETQTVASEHMAVIKAIVNIQDDKSGVISAQIVFSNPADKRQLYVGGSLSYPVQSSTSYELDDYLDTSKLAAGSYTAAKVILLDAAGNTTTITSANQISSLFNGQPSFTLTN